MAGQEVNEHTCSVCSCEYTDDEGGVEGYFGILPVTFCPTCFSCMCDMASQYNEPNEEEESNPEYDQLIQHLRGFQRIVINTCYGGFGLSREGCLSYLERAGIEYQLEHQPDRERQIKYGYRIMVNGREFFGRTIERDDPALVNTVLGLGERASDENADLKVVEIPAGIEWVIEDYDGREWVAEAHRTWD
jgi:hypothetical protein